MGIAVGVDVEMAKGVGVEVDENISVGGKEEVADKVGDTGTIVIVDVADGTNGGFGERIDG